MNVLQYSRLKQQLIVGCVIVCCAIANALFFFGPVIPILGQHAQSRLGIFYEAFFHTSNPEIIFGEGTDPLGSFWIVTKVRHMLTGQSDSFLSDIYAPYGFDIGKHEGFAWGDTILSIPWEILIGTPGFYNLHLFQTLCLSFIGCAYLARAAGAKIVPSLLIAHIATIHNFSITEMSLGRPTQVYWLFQCIFVIGVLNILKGKHPRFWSVIAGISFAWSCLVYWFGAVAIGFCVMLLFFAQGFVQGKYRNTLIYGSIIAVLSIAITFAVTARVSLPILLGTDHSYASFSNPPEMYLNALFFYIPLINIQDIFETKQVFLLLQQSGISFHLWILSGIVFAFGIWDHRSRWWACLSLFAATITFGSAIRIGGIIIPTAYAFIQTVFPPLIRCTDANRMMNASVLCCVVAFSMLLRHKKGFQRLLLYVFLGSLVFFNIQYFPKEAVQATRNIYIKEQLHAFIAQQEGGLIHVPLIRMEEEYVEQLWHGQSVFGGQGMYLLRSDAHKEYEKNNLFLSELLSFDEASTSKISYRQENIQQLIADGFLYIVFHKTSLQRPMRDYIDALQIRGTDIEKDQVYVISLQQLLSK